MKSLSTPAMPRWASPGAKGQRGIAGDNFAIMGVDEGLPGIQSLSKSDHHSMQRYLSIAGNRTGLTSAKLAGLLQGPRGSELRPTIINDKKRDALFGCSARSSRTQVDLNSLLFVVAGAGVTNTLIPGTLIREILYQGQVYRSGAMFVWRQQQYIFRSLSLPFSYAVFTSWCLSLA